ncbi:MAG: dUTP diphosphatase [Spirochaetia bacterium]|nr:dUTP diphosphatase [Spirochaetia bacterium]MBO7516722.1 dUTP diphosphatase [Spirochaetia bacterium]
MEIVKVICKAEDKEFLPVYSSAEAAGADLKACIQDDIVLKPGQRYLVPTGLSIQLPVGYEAQIRPRSGLAVKHGISLVNTPGTIDSDYRGEVKIIMINLGQEDFVIRRGDRIAQMVIAPVTHGMFALSDSLDTTDRGAGGFGSTGV